MFTPEQLYVIERLVRDYPESWALLRNLHKYDTYLDQTGFGLPDTYKPLSEVIIYIEEQKENVKVSHIGTIVNKFGVYHLLRLGTNRGNLIADKAVKTIDRSLRAEVYNKGYDIHQLYNIINISLVLVNKQQLKVLSYMFTCH